MAKSGGSQFSEAGPSAEGQAQGGSGQPNESQKEAEAEGKREIMAQILSNEARERLARIQLVRPQKAQGISDLLLRMAQSGQIRGKVSEDQLVGILDQVEAMEKSKSASQQQGTIKVSKLRLYVHLLISFAVQQAEGSR